MWHRNFAWSTPTGIKFPNGPWVSGIEIQALMGHIIMYPSHESFTASITILTTIIILFFNLNNNVNETKKKYAALNYIKMPFMIRY